MDVGTTLRTARERRNLSVEDLARNTKIGTAQLQAVEDNAFDRLPGGIFARGFLRAYAREVGLDPEAIISQFLAQTAPAAPAGPAEGHLSNGPIRRASSELDFPQPGRAVGGYVLLAAALLLAMVFFTRSSEPDPALAAAVADADTLDLAGDGVELASGGVPPSADAVAAHNVQPLAAESLIRLDIAPQGPCWVEVTADGQLLVYRLMHAGERESIDVRQEVTIRVGDPAAFSFTINGHPGRSIGRAGTPAAVRLTRDNYQQFLAVF